MILTAVGIYFFSGIKMVCTSQIFIIPYILEKPYYKYDNIKIIITLVSI